MIKSLSLQLYPWNILYPSYQIQIGRILRQNIALCKLYCFLMRKFQFKLEGEHFCLTLMRLKCTVKQDSSSPEFLLLFFFVMNWPSRSPRITFFPFLAFLIANFPMLIHIARVNKTKLYL